MRETGPVRPMGGGSGATTGGGVKIDVSRRGGRGAPSQIQRAPKREDAAALGSHPHKAGRQEAPLVSDCGPYKQARPPSGRGGRVILGPRPAPANPSPPTSDTVFSGGPKVIEGARNLRHISGAQTTAIDIAKRNSGVTGAISRRGGGGGGYRLSGVLACACGGDLEPPV